jgi:hypothetical protein
MRSSTFVREYGKGAGLLFSSAVVSYFLVFYSSLSPPIKPRQAIFGMSVLVESFGVLVGLNAATTRKPPLKTMLFFVCIYLISIFSLTFRVPTSESGYRDAIGLVCKKAFLDLYGPSCYWIEESILGNESFNPEKIWELWSIEIVRVFVSTSWLIMIGFVVLSISISVRRTEEITAR